MCGCFCIGFIDFMFAGKKLTDVTSLFSPYDFKKNDDIILSYFKNKWMQFHGNWLNNLDWSTKQRLNKITKIENYFIERNKSKKYRQ